MLTIDVALRIANILASCGALIGALEDWRNQAEFADDGFFSWGLASLEWRPPRQKIGWLAQRLLFGFATCRLLIRLRVLAAVGLLLLSLLGRPAPVLDAGLAALIALMLVRSAYGGDGADQMLLVVFSGLALAGLLPRSGVAPLIPVGFVAAQLTLSYIVAGVAKAVSREWRDGSGITGVLSTYGYGSPAASALLRSHPSLALIMSWSVILFESTFWLAWLLPWPAGLVYLAMGAMFHLGVALLMGLNTFVFAFLATYPIMGYCLMLTRPLL